MFVSKKNLIESIRSIEYKERGIFHIFGGKHMEYLTSAECAEKWNVSQRWVAIYCKEELKVPFRKVECGLYRSEQKSR